MAKKTLLDNIIESIKGIDEGLDKRDGSITQAIADLNYKVVEPAKSAADSAVAYANDAIKKSKVNSQAIDDINSAVSDAVSDAAVARSDGLRAWNAAQSNVNLIDLNYASASASISSARTEALAAADEAKKSASAAQADIVAVRSDVAVVQADVTATRSDVAVAKIDIADTKTTLAQTASNLNSKITGVETSLADTTSALSDAKTAFNSDVAEAKNLASAAQTTADSAIKSASSVASDLTAVASQAKANADGITKVTSDVGTLQTTVADNSGNISKIQETAKQIQQAVSDNAGNITVAKQTADSAVAVASDAKSNATVAIQTASQASITASNASGQAASAVLTAQGAITTANDANSNATVAVQTASGASLTATNATNDATIAKQTASEAKVQASNAESDFAQLSIRAGQIEASVANNSGAIASVQQTANGLTTTVANITSNGGGTNLLTGTAKFGSSFKTNNGTQTIQKYDDATNYIQYTSNTPISGLGTYWGIFLPEVGQVYTLSADVCGNGFIKGSTFHYEGSDNGNLSQVNLTSDWQRISNTFTVNRNSGWINWVIYANQSTLLKIKHIKIERGTVAHDWSPAPEDLQNQFTQVKQTVDGITTTVSNIQGDVSQLKVSASSASVALSDAAGNISSLQATATSYSAALSDTNSNVASVTATASELETKYADAAGDISQIKTDAKGMTQTISDAQGDIAKLKTRADGFDTQFSSINGSINKIQTDATGTTQTLANTKSDVAVLQSRADGLDAKYANAAGDINTLKTNASGISQTLTNAQGDISTLKSTVTGVQNTLTDAQGNISTLQSDVSGLKKTTSDNAGSIATLQATANTLTSQMSGAQGDISTLKQTASDFSSKVSGMETSLSGANSKINDITSNGGGTNILRNTDPTKIDNILSSSTWVLGSSGNGQAQVVTLPDVFIAKNGFEIYGNTSGNRDFVQVPVPWDNAKYVFSVYAKIADVSSTTSANMMTRVWSNQVNKAVFENHYTLTSKNWVRVTMNIDASSFYTQNGVSLQFGLSGIGSIDFAEPMLEKGTVAHDWSPAPEDTDAKITANTTAINQNKTAIALKADQTTVDKTNGTVQQLQSQLQVQAGQIATKITQSDVTGMLTGYATQDYTQTQIKQTSDSLNANITSIKSDLTQSYTNLSATVDGIQAQVYNSDGTSKITQLSNLIATKVSSDDFNNLSKSVNLQTLDSADINTMKTNGHYYVHNLANTPIQGWVYVDVVGNGNDRIRQDVYQDIDNQHCYRRWNGSVWTPWSKGATESEIVQLSDDINLRVKSADLISQINLQAGTALIQSNKLVLDAGTTVFTGDAFIPSAAISSISADKIMLGSTSLYNSDGTLNLVNTNDGTTSKITVSQGNVNFDGVNKNASIIKFASDNNTNAFTVNPTGATVTPTLFFERFDQTVGHWLGFTRNEVENEGVTFHTWDDDGQRFFVSCHARFDKNLSTLGTFSQGSWDGTTAKPEAGVLTIKGGNTIWSGSDFLAIGDNINNTYTNVMAKSFSQQSTLSSKTNIEAIDQKDALDLINQTDIRSYQYRSDVEQGKTKRYTSLIIDDVNDVSQYHAPDEFVNEERTGRDDGSAVGYLFLAVKELTRRIKTLEEKLNG